MIYLCVYKTKQRNGKNMCKQIPLPVINGVITPINVLKSVSGVINLLVGVISPQLQLVGAHHVHTPISP